jgi:hypothetical protein
VAVIVSVVVSGVIVAVVMVGGRLGVTVFVSVVVSCGRFGVAVLVSVVVIGSRLGVTVAVVMTLGDGEHRQQDDEAEAPASTRRQHVAEQDETVIGLPPAAT